MAEGDKFLKFWIKCYHYTVAGKHRRKIKSHSASQDYVFEKIEDNSGILENIQKSSEHVFITFTKGIVLEMNRLNKMSRNISIALLVKTSEMGIKIIGLL